MRLPLITIVALFLILGCVEKREQKSDKFDTRNAAAASEKLISHFQKALKKELVAALSDGGAGKAISVCNLKAPMIADSFSTMPGISIKRVSLKQRNQQIIPDRFEDSVLNLFANSAQAEPSVISKIVDGDNNKRRYRYMKEIKTGQLCLNCHGDPSKFSASVTEALARDYPDDPAVGYKLGESRGAFSIIMEISVADPSIDKLLGK